MSPISKQTLVIAASALFSLSAHAAPLDCVNGVNGSGLCEVPPGMNRVTIEAWGGGGGGAGSDPALLGGGGGGGGSYCGATFAVTAGTALTVTAGFGGPSGSPSLDGLPGMPSSVTGLGIAGMLAEAGVGGRTNPTMGGAGGSTASCNAPSATKFAGGAGSDFALGGGGGGSARATAPGNDAGAGDGTGGAGEAFGGDGGGATGNDGSAGFAPGGGGGGAFSLGGFSGGAGGFGQVKMSFAFAPPVPVAPASIPTLSQWGLIAVSSLLAMFGIAGIRRKR